MAKRAKAAGTALATAAVLAVPRGPARAALDSTSVRHIAMPVIGLAVNAGMGIAARRRRVELLLSCA